MHHPLAGATARTIWGALRHESPLPFDKRLRLWGMLAGACSRASVNWVEPLWCYLNRSDRERMPAPVFILGHWRSGTTHLYNILSKAPNVAYVDPIAAGMPGDVLFLGRLLRSLLVRALPGSRLIDHVAVNEDSPQEDEFGLACLQRLSFLHAMYFPQNFVSHFHQSLFLDDVDEAALRNWESKFQAFLYKVWVQQRRKQLVLKNPAHMGRVRHLLRLWPKAKFIHIYRDPVRVIRSTQHYYQKLMPALAMQSYAHVDFDRFIFDTYEQLMERMYMSTAELPESQFIELKYEDLEQNPRPQLKQVYDRLQLPGYADAEPSFIDYLESVKGFSKNKFESNAVFEQRVYQRLKGYYERWDYKPPC